MKKFIYFLIARGYLSCIEQGSNKKLIKAIIKNNPLLVKAFYARYNRYTG